MHYLMTHPGAAWALTVVHLRLSLLPVLIGLMSAVPLGLLVQRAPLLRRLTTATASVIFRRVMHLRRHRVQRFEHRPHQQGRGVGRQRHNDIGLVEDPGSDDQRQHHE